MQERAYRLIRSGLRRKKEVAGAGRATQVHRALVARAGEILIPRREDYFEAASGRTLIFRMHERYYLRTLPAKAMLDGSALKNLLEKKRLKLAAREAAVARLVEHRRP